MWIFQQNGASSLNAPKFTELELTPTETHKVMKQTESHRNVSSFLVFNCHDFFPKDTGILTEKETDRRKSTKNGTNAWRCYSERQTSDHMINRRIFDKY